MRISRPNISNWQYDVPETELWLNDGSANRSRISLASCSRDFSVLIQIWNDISITPFGDDEGQNSLLLYVMLSARSVHARRAGGTSAVEGSVSMGREMLRFTQHDNLMVNGNVLSSYLILRLP